MRAIFLISLLALLVACRPASVIPTGGDPDDPTIPKPPGEEQTVSIAYLKTLYNSAPVRITGEWRISGAVVSSDREGNFYKTLVVADETGGIEVKLDAEEIFKLFMIHTRVAVRCNGLWLGSYGGTLQLGAEPFGDYETQNIPQTAIAEHIQSDEEFYGEVRARTLTFGELSHDDISTFVAFEGVRFAEQGESWAETEPTVDSDGDGVPDEVPSATDRHIVDADGGTLIVRTSRHARFAAWPLPEGTGRIEGVLGYFNGDYQLVVCDSEKFTPARDQPQTSE